MTKFVFLLVTGTILLGTHQATASKKELQLGDCSSPETVVMVKSLRDTTHPTGPVTFESVLKASYVSHFNVDQHAISRHNYYVDSSHVDLKISIKRWVGFWYVNIPTSFLNKILHSLENRRTKLNKRNNMLELKCPDKLCLPQGGRHTKTIHMDDILSDSPRLAKLLHIMGSGWYKVKVEGWTAKQQKAFCFEVEMETKF